MRTLPKILVTAGWFLASSAIGAQATCLSIDYSGPFWVNHCSTSVWVNWTDNSYCGNWSCSDRVGPGQRSTASIGSRVQWCEWTGGATGRGPC